MATTAGTPAYESVSYREQSPTWAYLLDIFRGSDAWLERDINGELTPNAKANVYLPQEPAEDAEQYLARLKRSPWDDRFSQAILKFVNLILSNGFSLKDVPLVMEADLNNLDNQGLSLRASLERLMILSLRDGHCFALIDYPTEDPSIRSQADFIASGRRPYWVIYEASQIIYAPTHVVRGRIELLQVTLKESVVLPAELFNERVVTRYRVLFPGGWQLFEELLDEQGNLTYPLVGGGVMSSKRIPLVCFYGGARSGFFRSEPPLKSLADLNVTHYQVKSDHLRKLHLCCMPVPELRDSMRPAGQELQLGPNSFIHILDPQGSFNWKEPLATSIEQSRREVLDLVAAMDILSGSYLADPSDRQAALTTQMQSAEVESLLTAFVNGFSDGATQALDVHASYYGLSDGGDVVLSGEIIKEKGTDSQLLAGLNNLASTLLTLFQQGRVGASIAVILIELLQFNYFLPEDFDYSKLPAPVDLPSGAV